MTWEKFLSLRAWAMNLSEQIDYPVYLVGSALYKEVPRDIDISIIIPLKEYEVFYGKLPEKIEDYNIYLRDVVIHTKWYAKAFWDCVSALGEKVNLDLKICPDTWFKDKPRLLLSEERR
jgi:hypothetical protein